MKLLGPGGQFAGAGGVLLPRDGWIVVGDLPHGNAVLNGANQRAEIAPNAGLFDDLDHWTTFPVSRFSSLEPPDRLMRAILARRPAQLALNAFVLIDVSQQMIVEIEIFPLRDARQPAAANVGERAVAAFVHPVRQAVNQVFDDLAGVIRNLADRAAHAALTHAVRAAEVELDAVGAATLRLLHHLMPRFAFRLHHQRSDDRMFRIIALDFRDLFEVVGNRPVADELDVVEAHHPVLAEIDRAATREDVDDRLADRFPDGPAPTLVVCLGHLG